MDDNDLNEDWTKVSSWDVRLLNGDPVTDLGDLISVLPGTPEQDGVARLKEFMELPAWQAAPDEIKTQAAELLRAAGEGE